MPRVISPVMPPKRSSPSQKPPSIPQSQRPSGGSTQIQAVSSRMAIARAHCQILTPEIHFRSLRPCRFTQPEKAPVVFSVHLPCSIL